MQTVADMLSFIKRQARITGTSEDSVLIGLINESFLRLSRQFPYSELRVVATFTTVSGQQNYDLPADFDRLVDDSIRFGTTGYSLPGYIVPIVADADAEIYGAIPEVAYPTAVQVVAGISAPLALRFLPAFSATPQPVYYTYLKRPTEVTLDSDPVPVFRLAEAVCWEVMLSERMYSRDPQMIALWERRSRLARWAAQSVA